MNTRYLIEENPEDSLIVLNLVNRNGLCIVFINTETYQMSISSFKDGWIEDNINISYKEKIQIL